MQIWLQVSGLSHSLISDIKKDKNNKTWTGWVICVHENCKIPPLCDSQASSSSYHFALALVNRTLECFAGWVREVLTFTEFLVNQVVSSRTQALITNLQVIANMRATTIVVQALVWACSGKKKKRFNVFISKDVMITINKSPLDSPHSLRGSSDQSLQSRRPSHTFSMLIHSPLRHLNLVGPSQCVAVH